MTRSDFEKVFADCYKTALKSSFDSFQKSLRETADKNGKLSGEDVTSVVFTESLNASACLIKEVLESVLEFDD